MRFFMDDIQQQALFSVQSRVRDYARYSQSRNGLGTTVGGIIGIAVYLINGFLGHTLLTIILTFALTICWLLGKEMIRARWYRPFGRAQEIWPTKKRQSHRIVVAIVTLFLLFVWIFFLQKLFIINSLAWLIALFALVFMLVTPWIIWRYLRTDDEFIIGIYLLLSCMVTSVGSAFAFTNIYSLLGTLLFPLIGIGMIAKGFQEHSAFLALKTQLIPQEDQVDL
jgi:MFS family permease